MARTACFGGSKKGPENATCRANGNNTLVVQLQPKNEIACSAKKISAACSCNTPLHPTSPGSLVPNQDEVDAIWVRTLERSFQHVL